MHASAAPAAALQPKKDGRAHPRGAAIDDAGAQGSTRSESVRWVEGAAAPTLHAEAVRPALICLKRHAWCPLAVETLGCKRRARPAGSERKKITRPIESCYGRVVHV